MPRFNLDDYVSVQERIVQFWHAHPEGRIITCLQSDSADFKVCRYEAAVYTDREDTRPVATGWAFEIAGGNSANATSHEENAETSAIGRALANLGYATSQKTRPSREEMAKVERFADEQGFAKPVPIHPPTSRVQPTMAVEDRPQGIYLVDEAGEEIMVPSVARQHGVNNMADVTAYTRSNGFASSRKGDLIRELENTYRVSIRSGRGTNQYHDPEVFPGELYDVAFFYISQTEAEG